MGLICNRVSLEQVPLLINELILCCLTNLVNMHPSLNSDYTMPALFYYCFWWETPLSGCQVIRKEAGELWLKQLLKGTSIAPTRVKMCSGLPSITIIPDHDMLARPYHVLQFKVAAS